MMLTAVRRLCGQRATGPSRVVDQSNARISAPISPPPARQSAPADLDAVVMGSTLENAHRRHALQPAQSDSRPEPPGEPVRAPTLPRSRGISERVSAPAGAARAGPAT